MIHCWSLEFNDAIFSGFRELFGIFKVLGGIIADRERNCERTKVMKRKGNKSLLE